MCGGRKGEWVMGVQRLQCGNRNGVRGAVARECSAVIIQ